MSLNPNLIIKVAVRRVVDKLTSDECLSILLAITTHGELSRATGYDKITSLMTEREGLGRKMHQDTRAVFVELVSKRVEVIAREMESIE